VVVGGGLAGLAAATLLRRAGREVDLVERAPTFGGRARTQVRDGFRLNFGPHALYLQGAAASVLGELGLPAPGAPPPADGRLTDGEVERPLPATPLALLRYRGLPVRSRLAALRFFAAVARGEPPPAHHSFDDWLASRGTPDDLARLLRVFLRLSTYVAASDRLSAKAAVHQLRQALGGVRYVDGGWETLVAGLTDRARAAGVRLHADTAVRSVRAEHGGVRIGLRDGATLGARCVVLAVGPARAVALLGPQASGDLRRYAAAARPVLAACLDLGLRRLPRPEVDFALDLDGPRYLGCHSVARGLAPPGAVLLQLAHYGEDDGGARSGLETWLDRLQPGWRSEVLVQRWLPAARVSEVLPEAGLGGLDGRPRVDGAGPDGVLLCGDWVGDEGLLSDASLASARAAARAAGGAVERQASP
jgi:phytoene dehydrogenase-like protein